MNFRIWSSALTILILGLVGFSCGETETTGTASEVNEAVEAAPGESGVGGEAATADASCVSDYQGRLCELLTEDLVRAHNPEAVELEQENRNTGSYQLCTYTWPSDRTRTMEVAGRSISIPMPDQVTLKNISTVEEEDPLAYFRRSYRMLSDEEKQRIAEQYREKLDEKVQESELTETGADFGEGLMATGLEMEFENVEGVGDAAAYGGPMEDILYVLDGRTIFEVVADISTDKSVNMAKATAIAKDLLERCE